MTFNRNLTRAAYLHKSNWRPHVKRQARKTARTAIYRAVYGTGGKTHNTPWNDPSRRRPEGWDVQSAWGVFEAYKADAALPRKALIEIASALKVDLAEVLS